MVDGRAGLQVGDQTLVRLLRERNKPFELVVNKIDGVGEDVAASDFHSLGIGALHTIAATHNRGVRSMIMRCSSPLIASRRHLSSSIVASVLPLSVDPMSANQRW